MTSEYFQILKWNIFTTVFSSFPIKWKLIKIQLKFNQHLYVFDRKHTVNYDVIDKYAHHLKSMGMHGIMVNGMTGEGMTLTMDERKKLTEKWLEVARKYELKMVVNIGGIDLPEIYELAEHAEKLKVDAVMLMPDLFYRPRVEEDLVMYLKDIMLHMPTRPVLYYHIPMMTEVYCTFKIQINLPHRLPDPTF